MEVYKVGSRTYIPTLLMMLRALCRYIVRNRETLDKFLETPEKRLLLDAVVVACDAFTSAVSVPTGD